MAELPWPVWFIVGAFVSIVSLFMGFLKPVSQDFFFKIMFFVGLIMILYGYIKLKLKEKEIQQKFEEIKYKRGEREVEIDIDDYRQRHQNKNLQYAHQNLMAQKQTDYGEQRTYNNPITSQQKYATHQTNHHQAHQTHHTHYAHHSQTSYSQHSPISKDNNQNTQRICPNCRTPLLKEHKICPICNARV